MTPKEREQAKQEYGKRHGLKPSKASIAEAINDLSGKPRKRLSWIDEIRLRVPGSDHTSIWMKDGKIYSIVTQPYAIYGDKLAELVDFARKNSLNVAISARDSWHYPGHTLLVEITGQQ
jgi:hypothetical protein